MGGSCVRTVTVNTPANGATVTSPVHYVASATTTTCSKGVASMGIYVNNKLVYVVNATKLDTQLSLAAGAEHTVVEEWDHCGGAAAKSKSVAHPGHSCFAGFQSLHPSEYVSPGHRRSASPVRRAPASPSYGTVRLI